jgi:methylmalonyl-CoA mutase
VDKVESWLSSNLKTDYICVCGNDETYTTMLDDVLSTITKHNNNTKVLLAGLPYQNRQEKLKSLGVTDFIHLKSNCYEQLSVIHQEMGLTRNEA